RDTPPRSNRCGRRQSRWRCISSMMCQRALVDRRGVCPIIIVIYLVMSRTISAAEFKAKCLAVLDRVSETGEAVTVPKPTQARCPCRSDCRQAATAGWDDERRDRDSGRHHQSAAAALEGLEEVIVLDTHALIWVLQGTGQLGRRAAQAVNRALRHDELWTSAI